MNASLTFNTLLRRTKYFLNFVGDRIVRKLTLGDHWVVEVVAVMSNASPELLSRDRQWRISTTSDELGIRIGEEFNGVLFAINCETGLAAV